MEFHRIAAAAITDYCFARLDMCPSLLSKDRRATLPEYIIITTITHTSGCLLVDFYVMCYK